MAFGITDQSTEYPHYSGIGGALLDVQVPGSHSTRFQAAPFCYGAGSRLCKLESPLSWIAVYTKQHHEKRVAELLVDQALDCYLPLYTSERKWSNHRTAFIQMPLFPTYLFVRISPELRIRVLRTPGVLGIVRRGSAADEVTNREIEVLRKGLHLRNPEPHEFEFAVGDTVLIASGPLKGIHGKVVRYKSSFRVVITAPLIQQSVSIEVAAAELEPVASLCTCQVYQPDPSLSSQLQSRSACLRR